MAQRFPRLTARFTRARAALRVEAGSPDGRAVAGAIAALAASDLPGFGDVSAAIPPTDVAFVRRVQGRNLWIWYRFTDAEIVLVTLTGAPPVPLDE